MVFTQAPTLSCFMRSDYVRLGVSTWSGFLVFGQNREPEPGYPGSLFWETGTGTGIPVKPGSRLPAGSGFTWFGNRFKKKKKKKLVGLIYRFFLNILHYFLNNVIAFSTVHLCGQI
jgi:hypothetical protein